MNTFDTPRTATLARFIRSEGPDGSGRVTGLSIEQDGIRIYTDSAEWCDDAGAGTFWSDTETDAIRTFKARVRRAAPVAIPTIRDTDSGAIKGPADRALTSREQYATVWDSTGDARRALATLSAPRVVADPNGGLYVLADTDGHTVHTWNHCPTVRTVRDVLATLARIADETARNAPEDVDSAILTQKSYAAESDRNAAARSPRTVGLSRAYNLSALANLKVRALARVKADRMARDAAAGVEETARDLFGDDMETATLTPAPVADVTAPEAVRPYHAPAVFVTVESCPHCDAWNARAGHHAPGCPNALPRLPVLGDTLANGARVIATATAANGRVYVLAETAGLSPHGFATWLYCPRDGATVSGHYVSTLAEGVADLDERAGQRATPRARSLSAACNPEAVRAAAMRASLPALKAAAASLERRDMFERLAIVAGVLALRTATPRPGIAAAFALRTAARSHVAAPISEGAAAMIARLASDPGDTLAEIARDADTVDSREMVAL